jgi:predicted Fe-S protein YdhL (DUF1289 family)
LIKEMKMMMNCTTDKAGCKTKCLKIGLMVVAGVAALGGVVMLLWNWLMPELFLGAQPVSYLQALGVLVLSKILFGGFRGGCHGRWKEHRQRWESMTPEEREQMKSQFKSRWGHCGSNKQDDAAK